MEHHISTKEGVVSLSVRQLIDTLLFKIKNKERPELVELSKALAQYIEEQKLYSGLTPVQLLTIGVGIGYWYRVFRSNNDVQVSMNGTSINKSDDKSNGSA